MLWARLKGICPTGQQWAIAVGSTGVAMLATGALWPVLDGTVSPLFFAAIMLSAWRGGLKSGLIATALATVGSAYFLLPPRRSLDVGFDDGVRLLVFLAVALLISWLDAARHAAEHRLRLARDRAQAAAREADAANRAKDRFLSILSHELRTPLAPALALASSLERQPDIADGYRDELRVIRCGIELEARLIDDLLDLGRIASGKLSIRSEPVDYHALIRSTLDILGPEVRDKGLRVELSLDASNHYSTGDPARLHQVFWNLLKNAIKFTPEGGTIRFVTDPAASPDAASIRVRVVDTGIGIAPAALERVFQPFEQGGEMVTRRYGGMGLGLAISKSLVEAHGGTIRADSAGEGRGTTIMVELPASAQAAEPAPGLAPAPTVPAATASAASIQDREGSARPARPLNILLVEDHADTARAMSRLLRGMRYEVTTADGVGTALAAARLRPFDLVISDIGLPDGTGYELMRELQAGCGITRGIALTGFGMEEDVARSRAAGFATHLTKPISLDGLEAAIKAVAAEARDQEPVGT